MNAPLLSRAGRVIAFLFLLLSFSKKAGALDYYWVNGSGPWSDYQTHWAKIPAPLVPADYHANVPTAGDDVFFGNTNGGAAYTVTVNSGSTVPKCRNMDWSAAPAGTVWGGGGGPIDIYGSVVLDANMSMTFSGEVHFKGTTGTNTIFSDGVHFSTNVYFEGTGGGWQLLDPIFFDQLVYHTGGLIETMGKAVTIGSTFYGNYSSGSTGQLHLGSSEFTIIDGTGWFYYLPSQFDAGTSHVKFIGNNCSIAGGSHNNTAPHHFYDISFFGNFGPLYGGYGGDHVDGTLTFHQGADIISYNGFVPVLNNVVLLGDGYIANAQSYNHLTLTAGKTYTVAQYQGAASTDQTILPGGTLTALGLGTCSQFITIKSWQFGTHFNFVNNSGATQTVHCAILEDCHATGTNTLEVLDGVNLGNNTGWVFTAPHVTPALYWVGGAGNWNDPNHWSTTDGGAPGLCLPNGDTDVFFTANSGFSAGDYATVDAASYCKSMDWTGVTGMPKFTQGANELFVYGSLTFAPLASMTYETPGTSGTIHFRAADLDNVVTLNGQVLGYNAIFEGSGLYKFGDAFTVKAYVSHYNGEVRTMGHPVQALRWDGNFSSNPLQTYSPNAKLWLGDPVGGTSSTVTLTDTYVPGERTLFANEYAAGQFMAMQSHINVLGTAGSPTVQTVLSTATHDYWKVSFLNGNFEKGNVLDKLTFTSLGNVDVSGHIHEVEFFENGRIRGNHSFDNITVRGSYFYQFFGGNVQTITAGGSITVLNGNCSNLAYFYVDNPTETAKIAKTSGSLALNHVILDNVLPDLTTGATYSAANSFGIQPQVATDWNITNPAPRNLFWVGGSGTWNDAAHWSLASGGAGGECPPTPVDNVRFDAASGLGAGSVVDVTQRWAFCKDMDWTGVTGGAKFYTVLPPYTPNQIAVFGSLTFSSGMVNDFAGDFWMRAKTPAVITSAGNHFKSSIRFMEPMGDWTLTDPLTLFDLVHYYGKFRTNDQLVTINGWWVNDVAHPTAEIFLGSSTIDLTGNNVNGYAFAIIKYSSGNFHGGTSHLIFETNAHGRIYSEGYNPEFYKITFKGAFCVLWGGSVLDKLTFEQDGDIDYGLGANGTIHEVEFKGNGYFSDSRSYHIIKFAPGKRYTFGGGYNPGGSNTQTIAPFNGQEGQFIAQGLPGQYIEMKSINPSAQAFIHMDDLNGTSTCTKYLFLTGMGHTGTEDIYVPTPGGNVQNNSGWLFFPCNPCPASIPVLDAAASTTSGCNPGQAKLVLAGLKADEWAIWYTDPAATTNLVYNGGTPGPAGNMFMPTITGPTTYYARVYSDGGLCESTVVLAVDITIVAPPALFNVMGGGSGCIGTNFPITLDGSQLGVTYTLYKDGVATATTRAGTGSPLDFGLQSMAATYTVVANINGTSCPLAMNGSAIITASALTAPAVAISNNTPTCGGEPLTLFETGGAASMWAWTGPGGFNSTDQNPVIAGATPANSGIYTVVVTAADGCTNTAQKNVTVRPQLLVAVAYTNVTCFGMNDGTIDLTVSGGSPGYFINWNFGGDQLQYGNRPPGGYSVNVVDDAGCGAGASFQITQPEQPLALLTSVTPVSCGGAMDGAISTTPIGGNSGGYMFNWTGPGGFTSSLEDLTGLAAGLYFCTLSDSKGCTFAPAGIAVLSNTSPVANAVGNQDLCQNTSTAPINFTGSPLGISFQWTNTHPSIGLPASGSGNIGAFTALNGSNVPVVATIAVTPVAQGGCMGTPVSFTITVNPVPDPAAGYCQQGFCSGDNPTVADLAPGGPNVKWYLTPTGGIALATSTPLVSGTYYAENLIGACASPVRAGVMVSVVTPAPGHTCVNGCTN